MPSFALRFVGQEALPSRLSEFDREQFFELTPVDVAAVREQFRTDHRLPAALTGLSPLQYQKQLRLLEARRLLIGGEHNVSGAAFAVGYESSSQFSRDYLRQFKASPRQDLRRTMHANSETLGTLATPPAPRPDAPDFIQNLS